MLDEERMFIIDPRRSLMGCYQSIGQVHQSKAHSIEKEVTKQGEDEKADAMPVATFHLKRHVQRAHGFAIAVKVEILWHSEIRYVCVLVLLEPL
jgi:hypothetical protein